jgi:hypothetical protein
MSTKNRPSKTKRRIRNQQIVSPPMPLTLRHPATNEEWTILVSAPTPADLIAIGNWVRSQWKPSADVAGLSKSDFGDLDQAERAMVIKEFAKAKASMQREMTELEAVAIIYTPEGFSRMIWYASKRHQPGIQLEKIKGYITGENYEQVAADFDVATGNADPDEVDVGDASHPAAASDIDPKAPGSD